MQLTFHIELNFVGVLIVLRTDLTLVDALVERSNVLNDERPFVRSLVVVDADARIRSEREQSDRQRMDLFSLLPGHLSLSKSTLY